MATSSNSLVTLVISLRAVFCDLCLDNRVEVAFWGFCELNLALYRSSIFNNLEFPIESRVALRLDPMVYKTSASCFISSMSHFRWFSLFYCILWTYQKVKAEVLLVICSISQNLTYGSLIAVPYVLRSNFLANTCPYSLLQWFTTCLHSFQQALKHSHQPFQSLLLSWEFG